MSARIDHDRAYELIPWLVNDTLPEHERAAVEAHVRDCVPCRLELKEQRSLSAAVRAQPTVHTSAARGFDRLLERLDVPGAPAFEDALGTTLARSRRRWLAAGAALAASAAAALVLIAWPGLFEEHASANYTTLADSPSATPAGVQLDLVFAATLAPEDRDRLLDEIGAKIVSGPSTIGRYRVQLAAPGSEKTLERLLEELNADARIRFAGRALTEDAP